MAQRYILAIDYAHDHAQRVLRRRSKKRSLGDIERKHQYQALQPVLSFNTVNVDAAGIRTFRPKSSFDIIREQHEKIHDLYTKARKSVSAPTQRVATTVSANEYQELHHVKIEVYNRPTTSHPKKNIRKLNKFSQRPKTTGNSKAVRLASDTQLARESSSDLLETSRTYRSINNRVQEQFSPRNHDISEGRYVRGAKKSDVTPQLDAWLTFGGAQDADGRGVIDTFANSENEDEYYNIDGSVGSRVAQHLKKGDKVRIGINGNVQSDDLRVRRNRRENSLIELEMQQYNMEKPPPVPLCWTDQLTAPDVKVIEAGVTPRDNHSTAPLDSHPVVFEKLIKDDNARPRIMSGSTEGHRVKQRFKSRPGLDGKEHQGSQLREITIASPTSVDEDKVNALSLNDLLQQQKDSIPAQHEFDKSYFHKDNKTSEVKRVPTAETDDSTAENHNVVSDNDLLHRKDILFDASNVSITESRISRDNDKLYRVLVQATAPSYRNKSAPTSSLGIGNNSTTRVKSPRLGKSGLRPTAPRALHKAGAGTGASIGATVQGDVEYIHFASQIKSQIGGIGPTRIKSMESIRTVRSENEPPEFVREVPKVEPNPSPIPEPLAGEHLELKLPSVTDDGLREKERPPSPSLPPVSISIPTGDQWSDRDSYTELVSHRMSLHRKKHSSKTENDIDADEATSNGIDLLKATDVENNREHQMRDRPGTGSEKKSVSFKDDVSIDTSSESSVYSDVHMSELMNSNNLYDDEAYPKVAVSDLLNHQQDLMSSSADDIQALRQQMKDDLRMGQS